MAMVTYCLMKTIPTCSAMIVFNRSYYGYGDLLSHENDNYMFSNDWTVV